MKNLKDLAKEFSMFLISDIPSKYINSNYDHRIKCGHQDIPEFLINSTLVEVGLFYECKQDTNYTGEVTYYIDNSKILVRAKDSDKLLMLQKHWGSKDKYYLHPYYGLIHKYNNITHYLKTEALKTIKEPNLIGVFSDKKLTDWVEYCNDYLKVMDSLLNEVNDKNKDIENQIQAFIDSLPVKQVQTYANTTDIDTPLFRIAFTHFKDQKYLQQVITYKGGLSNITKIENLIK